MMLYREAFRVNDRSANFSQYKTYSWADLKSGDALWIPRIQNAVNARLAEKGWTQVPRTTLEHYQVGTLVINLFDANTKTLIWRGSASGTLSGNSAKDIKNVDKAVRKMFAHFPANA
jgi:Domain of unknown function (DUF4136)